MLTVFTFQLWRPFTICASSAELRFNSPFEVPHTTIRLSILTVVWLAVSYRYVPPREMNERPRGPKGPCLFRESSWTQSTPNHPIFCDIPSVFLIGDVVNPNEPRTKEQKEKNANFLKEKKRRFRAFLTSKGSKLQRMCFAQTPEVVQAKFFVLHRLHIH